MSRLRQLIQYISSVFRIPRLVKQVSDHRDHAKIRIPTAAILLAWLPGFAARVKSREELGRLLDRSALQRLVGDHISADTLGRVLSQVAGDGIRTHLLVPIVQTLRCNKAWLPGSIGVAVDRVARKAGEAQALLMNLAKKGAHLRSFA